MNLDHIYELVARAERLAESAYDGPASPIEAELTDTLRCLVYAVQALAVNQVALVQQVHLLLERKR